MGGWVRWRPVVVIAGETSEVGGSQRWWWCQGEWVRVVTTLSIYIRLKNI